MQRLLLEVTYEALENSGITLSEVSGTRTSCFVGCFTKDYEEMQRRDMELAPKYQSTGASPTMLSNRLSYFFNLKGPSITLDTACSSGLVAVHLACQSLQVGESSMAIVGGSNLILSPDIQIEMSDMHFLSPDSISYAFDERANGYARGEGVGVIVLKPLHLALKNKDPIRAVIRGTAASSDGKTPGITLPSKNAQIELIRMAYHAAGCDTSQTGYFEAHGTGTAAGDPIETGAIGEVFAPHRPLAANGERIPLALGSLKTNIGHLEGASGIAGLIKAVLSVEKGIIAPNVWFNKGNPRIDFETWRIQVPTEAQPWPWKGLRRASINSFGYGGTNAHVVIDDAHLYTQQFGHGRNSDKADPQVTTPLHDALCDISPRKRVFILSANDKQGLSTVGEQLADYVKTKLALNEERSKEQLLDDLAYTLSEHRSQLSYSCAIVASDQADLEAKLKNPEATLINMNALPRIGYIFTGQGAQWHGMGRELLRYPVFKESLLACETYCKGLGSDWSLMEELLRDKATTRVNEAIISQPLCTAIQIALVDLFKSWGIYPHSVIGHSSGEIAAAYAAGAISADSAMSVAFLRGLLTSKIKELGYQGSMMAVRISEEEANKEIARVQSTVGTVVVACINSPQSVTISGDTAAIQGLQKALQAKNISAKILQVDVAYHSHHMQAIAEDYLRGLLTARVFTRDVQHRVHMFSSVTENLIDQNKLGAEYWVSNLVGCVRFSGALQKMCASKTHTGAYGVETLLELGPHALFRLPVREIIQNVFGPDSKLQYISSLVRNKPADVTILDAVGALCITRYPVKLHEVNFPMGQSQTFQILTDLPTYPWNHTRGYWHESRLSRDYRFRPFARTDILGAPVNDWNPMEPRFRNFLRLREQPWLRDHVVQGDVLFPACGYLCMAIEACRQMSSIAPAGFRFDVSGEKLEYILRDVTISKALVIPERNEGVETCFSMRAQSLNGLASLGSWHEFRVYSYTIGLGWAQNCQGFISMSAQSQEDNRLAKEAREDFANASMPSSRQIPPEAFYERMNAAGITYGPLFQGLKAINIDPNVPGQAAGIVEVTNTLVANQEGFEHDRLLHPATLDNLLQLALAGLGGDALEKFDGAMIPTHVSEIYISGNITAQAGDHLNVVVSAKRSGSRKAIAEIRALDPATWKPVVRINGSRFIAIDLSRGSVESAAPVPKLCYKPVWEPDVELLGRYDLDRELRAAPQPDDRSKNVVELERIAYHFIEQALLQVHDREVAAMLPHHQRFYQNLRKIRDTIVMESHPQQPEEWHQMHTSIAGAELRTLTEYYRHHATAYDGKLLVRMGEALPLVFRQAVDPLALMTEENLLENYYTTAVGMPNVYAQLSRYLGMLSHKFPDLDYLEIGAGTGGATVPTLKGLMGCDGLHRHPRLRSYAFTDISSYFLARAAEKFEDSGRFMTFKKLDIERHPEAQGFKSASYDVIIAANVLHATCDINCTLSNVRKLLRPGGKLVLLEMTNRLLAATAIFGTLPGWWNASEEWRSDGPLLTEDQWEDVLCANGFSSLQASSPDVLEPLEEGTRLMIASALESNNDLDDGIGSTQNRPRVAILYTIPPIDVDIPDIATVLKRKLESMGLRVRITPFSGIGKEDLTDTICISFAELDTSILVFPSSDCLNSLQHIANTSAGLIWVTRGAASGKVGCPDLAIFHGLARSLRAENETFPCITIDLDAAEKLSEDEVASLICQIHDQKFGLSMSCTLLDSEFIEQGGILFIKRAIQNDTLNNSIATRTGSAIPSPRLEPMLKARPLKMVLSRETRSSYIWEDNGTMSQPIKAEQVEIEIAATSLNLTDISKTCTELCIGSFAQECAGIITKTGSNCSDLVVGDHVVAWCPDTFATHVRAEMTCVYKVPENMNLESATTLPLAFATAYYALVRIARLAAGESVLVHGLSNSVGHAAVRIALEIGAEVFLTVNSESEASHAASMYGLDQHHIFSSENGTCTSKAQYLNRDLSIDVLLDNGFTEAVETLSNYIAPFGRFIDMRNRSPQICFPRNISFTSIDTDLLYKENSRSVRACFRESMKFITENQFDSFPVYETKSWSELPEAIDSLRKGTNKDKVVIVPKTNDMILVS
jgi:acyl transferase domain-containing protein/NADPH:quinone reductase-like Zn-dependent oxidoreductase/SAM-dependent methyltransferase